MQDEFTIICNPPSWDELPWECEWLRRECMATFTSEWIREHLDANA